ncbi:flagellar basal body rod protein FlgB [Baekduia soli]|uniref:Flagellar basal body rod protein FlgB n=1 Tax=Baekduia soli TaxID=496014 RepID=A0A5B8U1F3_9ACTN|nr:flagellar basal body rod protein FlgB [Baekduia soli]QEC46833.1 flagellar basal body rod protein FlgB [Baekduia soli]
MELFDTTQTGLERALSGSALRQEAIASNIANVNTPGYRRQDVDFQSALQAAWGEGRSAVEAVSPAVSVDPTAAVRQDGSSVDIDVESAAQSKNGLQYEAITTVLKTRNAILRSAIGIN